MVHLLPLPGSPGARPLDEVLGAAALDAELLLTAGFEGLVVENYGDSPFHKDQVQPITVAAMTRVAGAIRRMCGDRLLAINVLRNDARAALAVAKSVGAAAIRVNVHSGVRITDQGLVEGRADRTVRLRRAWDAQDVAIWADVAVKHSTHLGPGRPVGEEARELVERAGADVVVVSGSSTGAAVDPVRLNAVVAAVKGTPVLVGSGATPATVAGLLRRVSGVIVGTALKQGGITTRPVDPARARDFVAAAAG
jgi:uncharacterized protein